MDAQKVLFLAIPTTVNFFLVAPGRSSCSFYVSHTMAVIRRRADDRVTEHTDGMVGRRVTPALPWVRSSSGDTRITRYVAGASVKRDARKSRM
jgi:hypothetical protein